MTNQSIIPITDLSLQDVRRWYADEVRYAGNIQHEPIIEAFANVPREHFLGPGPWQIVTMGHQGHGYITTPDNDPAHVYHNVMIAIDATRHLHNGSPSSWGNWLEHAQPRTGDQIMHVGCGTGYYSAILAELSGATGSVLAFEIDPDIALRARDALQPWHQVHVVDDDGSRFVPDPMDLIVVSAGVGAIPRAWIDCLKPAGRLLVPLTSVQSEDSLVTQGRMLRIKKIASGYAAKFVSYASFYPCIGTQNKSANAALRAAFESGGASQIQSLRVDRHVHTNQCWLHTDQWCLSKRSE